MKNLTIALVATLGLAVANTGTATTGSTTSGDHNSAVAASTTGTAGSATGTASSVVVSEEGEGKGKAGTTGEKSSDGKKAEGAK